MTTTSNISFGSVTTNSSGSSTLGTTMFGVDVDELVTALVDAKKITNTKREDKITANTAVITAYSTLQTKLKALQTAADVLSNPRVTSTTTDAFDTKTTLSRESGSIAAASLYGVSTDSSAVAGSYSLTINRIASTDSITSSTVFTDTGTSHPVTTNGDLILNGTTVSLTSSMTLTQIKDTINDLAGTTKVRASVIQAGTNNYQLVLKATETGNAIDLTGSTTSVLTDLGVAASGATDTSLSAEVILDGVTAYRSTNSISDLIPGLSFQLYQADADKPVTLTVDNDLSTISDKVAAFISAYNDIVTYVKEQRKVSSDGTVGEDQVLHNDNLLLTVYRKLQSIFGSGSAGVDSGALKSLGDVGIDLSSDGTLSVTDDNKFEDALLSNLDQVRDLFGFNGNASSGLSVVDRPNDIPASVLGQTVTVRVSATDANGLPTAAEFEVNGTVYAATISNGFIKGAEGSIFEGFTVGYTGGVVTAGTPFEGTIKPTQGIAEQVMASLDPMLKETTGSIAQASTALTDRNTRLQTQIDDYSKQLELYRARLLAQFQAAQTAISALESAKNSIVSYMDSLNSDS